MGVVVAPSGTNPRALRVPFLRAASDERLVARLRSGDDTAFETLYDRHHRAILAFCRHMLGDHGEAEDALQQTFISALPALRKDGREIHVKAFLFAIARNRCLTMLRSRREAVSLEDVHVSTDGLPDVVEARADLRELLADLQRLPDDQRAALVMAEVGGLSHDDVAEVLGVRREKVKAIIFQGRENLMTWREARHTDCGEIREQLATLRGGALRRTQLRKHLDECGGCRSFKLEVQRQRSAMAAIMPVAPSVALKGSVLAAALGGGGFAATSGGLGAAAGGGLFGSLGSKLLVTAALAGGAGGYAAVEGVSLDPRPGNDKPAQSARSDASKAVMARTAASSPGRGGAAVTAAPIRAAASKPAKSTKRKRSSRRKRANNARRVVSVPVAAAPVQHQSSSSTGSDGQSGTDDSPGAKADKHGKAGGGEAQSAAKEQRKAQAQTEKQERAAEAQQKKASREQAASQAETAKAERDQRQAAADQEQADRQAEAEARKKDQQGEAPPDG